MVLSKSPHTLTGGTINHLEFVRALGRSEGVSPAPLYSELTSADAGDDQYIADHVAAIRRYAQTQHVTVLEVLAAHLLDDLPVSVADFITDYLEERKPQSEPGQVAYRTFFASDRPDLSEKMEDIIYGTDSDADIEEVDE